MFSMMPVASGTAIGELMTRCPIVTGPAEPVRVAAALLRDCRVRHLPVVVAQQLVGVLSLRDVLAADEEATVGSIMTPAPLTAHETMTVGAAARQMLAHRVSCLPVVTAGMLTGIFPATDGLRHAANELGHERDERPAVPVVQLMTARPVVVAEPQTPLAVAWRTMKRTGFRHLPVVQHERVLGMLSDRDVLATGRVWLDGDAGADALVVADAMSPRVVTIGVGAPAAAAARLLLRRRLGALPVLDREGRLDGIVTVSDFLAWIAGQ